MASLTLLVNMFPNSDQDLETQTPIKFEEQSVTVIDCLFCYECFTPITSVRNETGVEILSGLFKTLSKYMKWESPEEYRFDFNEEQFPFCSSCKSILVEVFKLDEQIQSLISSLISKIIYCEKAAPNDKRVVGAGTEKIQFYRRQTILQNEPLIHPLTFDQPPAGSKQEIIGSDVPEQLLAPDLNFMATAAPNPFNISSPSTSSDTVAAELAKFGDRIQQVEQNTFMYDSKYLFTCSENHWQCLACSQSYFTKFGLMVHWESSPCFGTNQPSELLETLPEDNNACMEVKSENQLLTEPVVEDSNLELSMQMTCPPPQNDGLLPYTCPVCAVSFKRKDTLQRHILLVHTAERSKTFVCQVCRRRFATQSVLKYHMHRHKKIPCPVCGKTYSVTSLYNHKKIHMDQISSSEKHPAFKNNNKYECNMCQRSFLVKSRLQKHVKTCGKKAALQQHRTAPSPSTSYQRNKKKKSDRYKSPQKRAGRASNAMISKKGKTIIEPGRVVCNLCHKTFRTQTNLYVHTLNVHTSDQDKAFSCRICGRKYAKECLLKHHFKVHEKVECDICFEIYSVSYLYTHKYIKHKSVDCRICNKSFGVDTIKEHIDWHKLQNPKVGPLASYHPRVPLKRRLESDSL